MIYLYSIFRISVATLFITLVAETLISLQTIPSYDEALLLQQIAAGNESAFRQVYDKHWNNIYAMAVTYLKSTVQAQDLVQDIFLNLWNNRQKLAEVKKLDSYLFIMARNMLISSLRKKVNFEEIKEDSDYLPDDFLSDNAITLKQSQEVLQKAMEQLTPQQRLIFTLSRNEGLSHEQIADKLGINRFTIKNHIVAALNTIRKYLREHGGLALIPLIQLTFLVHP